MTFPLERVAGRHAGRLIACCQAYPGEMRTPDTMAGVAVAVVDAPNTHPTSPTRRFVEARG